MSVGERTHVCHDDSRVYSPPVCPIPYIAVHVKRCKEGFDDGTGFVREVPSWLDWARDISVMGIVADMAM